MEQENPIPKHHIQNELCTTRPSYRDGKKLTSVKVYTIHQESKYLLIQNVPAVGAKEQLARLLSEYGAIADFHPLDDYPCEKFTEVYLVKYQRIQSARFAKKKLDNHSFFGGSLHICYVPEYESVQETREKLKDRRMVIASKIRQLEQESEACSNTQRSKSTDLPNGSQENFSPSLQHSTPPPPLPSLSQPPPPPPLPPPPPQAKPSAVPSFSSHDVSSDAVEEHSERDRTVGNEPQAFDQFMFQIPPPPMAGVSFDASQYRTPHFNRKDYGFAWVPSANAAFPPGYDPRLPQEGSEREMRDVTVSSSQSVNIQNSNDSLQLVPSGSTTLPPQQQTSAVVYKSHEHTAVVSKLHEPSSNTSTIVSGRGSKQIVIRPYKHKGAPPRFVPRQIKEKSDSKPSVQSNKDKDDALNREIRREAFQLGKDQGPELPTNLETRQQLLGQRPLVEPKVEASVLSSVRAIRKRLSKFISDTVPKQLKTAQVTKAVPPEDEKEKASSGDK